MLRPLVEDVDDVVIAQAEAFKQRIPILYTILIVNTVTLAYTHHDAGPIAVTLGAPGVIMAAMIIRLLHWVKLKSQPFTPDEARKVVGSTTRIAGVLGGLLLAWSVAMLQYDVQQQANQMTGDGHTVLYVGLTVICCIFLLMHVRAAAMTVTLAVVPAFCGVLIWNGGKIELVVAINLLLVMAAMTYVLTIFARDFKQTVIAKGNLRRLSETNTILANTDSVTGLPNRRRLFAEMQRVASVNQPFSVIVLDLDGFKQVNDLHGHPVGDRVLVEVGGRLATLVPENCCFARMGGDEFAVFLPGARRETDVLRLARELVWALRAPIILPEATLTVGGCAGISMAAAGSSETDHYKQADYALFHAKKLGRERVELFSPAHEEAIRTDGMVDQALKHADLDEQLTVLYQPIVRATDGCVVAYEALARWHHPELGAVSPATFVPIAERSDLIHALTRSVLKKALDAARDWPDDIHLKINISMRDLASPEQVLKLIAIVHRSQIAPSRLAFEITESVLELDLQPVQTALGLLRDMGISIAVDDFGSGYSNLRYIHHLRPQTIKIDRSFVTGLGIEPHAKDVIKTIIELCHNVGSRSLAEGAETQQQVDILRELGCDEIQGYHFGRPTGLADIVASFRLPDAAFNQSA